MSRTAELVQRDLGRVAYADAWALQKRLVDAGEEALLVCEHEPVVTTGRGTTGAFLVADRFPVFEVERGGAATYHGPGQIVAYPIVRLARHDLRAYLRALEEAVVLTLADFALPSGRRDGATGVWIDGARKICSIGVAARRWTTYHGLALNHDPDLSHFAAIRPCGFDAGVMTSMARELDAPPPRDAVVAALAARLDEALGPLRT